MHDDGRTLLPRGLVVGYLQKDTQPLCKVLQSTEMHITVIKLDEFIVRKSGLRSPDFLVLCFLNGSFLCSLAKLSPYSSRTPWPPIYLLLWCVLPLTHVHARYMLCQAVYHIRLLSISIRVCQSASTENTIVRLLQVSQPVKCEYYHYHHQNLPSP